VTVAPTSPRAARHRATASRRWAWRRSSLLLWPRGDVARVAPEVLAVVAAGVGAHADSNRCRVEAATGVCPGLATVDRELSVARRALAQAAVDLGARLVASGTPPCDALGVASLTDDPRCRRLVATGRPRFTPFARCPGAPARGRVGGAAPGPPRQARP
jgi:hypothetical protein